jgi:hypothetical protein
MLQQTGYQEFPNKLLWNTLSDICLSKYVTIYNIYMTMELPFGCGFVED